MKRKYNTLSRLAVLLCLLNMSNLKASAQNGSYIPLLQDGKAWYSSCPDPLPGMNRAYYEKADGDTLINGETFKKLCDAAGKVTFVLREEDGKIYDGSGRILMDFSLHAPQTFYGSSDIDNFGLYVCTEDTILVDGRAYPRKEMAEHNYGNTHYSADYWVEGIGSTYGLDPVSEIEVTRPSYVLDSCMQDGKLLFTRNDFMRAPGSDCQWVQTTYTVDNGGNGEIHFIAKGRNTYATIGTEDIAGKTYQRVYDCTHSQSSDKSPDQRYKYLFLMRSEDGRMLAEAESFRTAFPNAAQMFPEDGIDLVLYDYNAKLGDAYLGHDTIRVVAAGDTVLTDGAPRRTLTLSTGHQLVEGIGCTNAMGSLFGYLAYPTVKNEDRSEFTVLENYYNSEGHRVYVKTSEEAYNTITAGVQTVAPSVSAVDDTVYDLQGRRLAAAKLPKGIYVRQGHKFVVR